MKAILTFILSMLFLNCFAQSSKTPPLFEKGIVKGIIIDSADNSALQMANITLHRMNDSTMCGGIASSYTGEFLISNVTEGGYFLKVSFIGYKSIAIPNINISSNQKEFDAGRIKLTKSEVIMKETQIVGERSAEEFHLDKKVINVGQNLAATGGTAVDALQNQPSVQVDANGNLTLRGSGNFTVTIDGRPSVLSGTDALRQIPANIIDQIEIITNPSARYDAEGTAGIINIVTKKTNLTSTSGIVNAGVGSKDKYNSDFNMGIRTDAYNLTIGGDARRYNYTQEINMERNQSFNATNIISYAILKSRRDSYNARFAFDRFFSSNSTLGISGTYGLMDMNMSSITSNDVSLASSIVPTGSATDDNNKITAEYFNSSVNFTQIFTPKVNDLYFEATFTKLRFPSEQLTTENSILNDGSTLALLRGRENNTSRIDSRIKLNYKHNIAEKNTFETGAQATIFNKDMDIVSRDYDFTTKIWTINNGFSNKFNFKNNVYSAFATYIDKIIGFDYQLGTRFEYTDRNLDQITTNEQFSYKKLHFFPTLNISRKINDDQTIQLSYSRRIQRPFDGQLNPFSYFSDTYTATSGNPYLVPSFTHSFELNYQKSFSGVYLTLQTYFKKTEDGIEQIQRISSTGKLLLVPENVLNTTSAGAEISSNITVAPWLKLDPVVNIYNFTLNEKKEFDIKSQNTISWDIRLNTTLMLSAATRVQFFTNYYPTNITSQGEMKSFMVIGASIRQEFLEKKLIATLSAQNLFNQTKYNIISNSTGYLSNMNFRPEAPILNLTLSYNFNNFKRRNNEQVDINVNSGF